MPDNNRHRVLVISRSPDLRNELVTLLSGYGYFVEYAAGRMDGMRKFRSHKQSIVILDMPILRTFPQRLFRYIRLIRKNAIILIAASRRDEADAVNRVDLGAYDILHLPLKTEFLKLTLNRALAHHRLMVENIFVKNVVFFCLILLPIWAILAALLLMQ